MEGLTQRSSVEDERWRFPVHPQPCSSGLERSHLTRRFHRGNGNLRDRRERRMHGRRGMAVGPAHREIDREARRLSRYCRESGILPGWFIVDRRVTRRDVACLCHLRLSNRARNYLSGRDWGVGGFARWQVTRHWRCQWGGAYLEGGTLDSQSGGMSFHGFLPVNLLRSTLPVPRTRTAPPHGRPVALGQKAFARGLFISNSLTLKAIFCILMKTLSESVFIFLGFSVAATHSTMMFSKNRPPTIAAAARRPQG